MTKKTLCRLSVNGAGCEVAVRPSDTLALALRDACGLTGTKIGCDMGTCGCCNVLLDGKPHLACLTLALEAEGREITTVEGLVGEDGLHPVQEAFATCGGSQCGYCTPGFIVTSVALLAECPAPSREEIKQAISGNLCRCTGYVKIVDAIERAAVVMREEATEAPIDDPSGETHDADAQGRRQPATAGR
jgi:aerobic-type carbon monoxide dehydrogenase small subunit (CoxS/CutS family)